MGTGGGHRETLQVCQVCPVGVFMVVALGTPSPPPEGRCVGIEGRSPDTL